MPIRSMLHLYAALPKKERRQISERTKSALASRKLHGTSSAIRQMRAKPRRQGGVQTLAADRFADTVLPII